MVLLFAAGLLASLGGRASRRAGAQAREEADAIQLLHAVTLAAASGEAADQVAADGLVLPAEGTAIDLVRDHVRVGALVVLPAADRPLLRTTRTALAAVAHVLAVAGVRG